jgi:hypothetical protein
MNLIRNKTLVLFILMTCILGACETTKIILTPEQQAVVIVNGNQSTTLDLMNTHVPITTEDFTSEYQARIRAIDLKADIAQLIVYSNYSLTYRFWKKK